jgi:carbon monoxide dehydrogenase subunit G
MQLEHTFTVPADIDTVWAALLDPQRVAPCMPGATLTSVEGDNFAGGVKVKLGPISLLYKGSGEFVERDEQARRLVIKAAGKDSRGNGTASATVTVTLVAEQGATNGTVLTDLSITGKPAQFGRGLISEVGGKILETFAQCLASKLGEAPAPEPQPAPEAAATESTLAKPQATPAREPLHIVSEAEPVDLLEYAGPSVLKRAAPVLAVLALLLIVVLRRRR